MYYITMFIFFICLIYIQHLEFVNHGCLKPISANILLQRKRGTRTKFLSDHFPISVVFKIQ